MKYITTLLLTLLSSTLIAQDSWVNVIIQTDNYGVETTWEIYQDTTLIATSPVYDSNSYYETMVTLESGQYNFVIYDAFGDGICCAYGEGFFGLSNSCGLNTFVYDFAGPTATVYFDLLACPPPLYGCADATACNYDENVTNDDGSCDYSCLVYGCMESEALNFNPWANAPLPCTFPPTPCDIEETGIIIITTPDSYPVETSWELIVNSNIVASSTGFTIPDVPQSAYFCVAEGDTIETIIYDTFGDGLCGSCWGGVDGYFNVFTACGDSIFAIGGQQQFDTVSSGPYIVPQCTPFQPQGCTTPGYVEYNPNVIIDDGSCITPIVLGCTDITMFNYDVLANTMDVHPSCQYDLTITDGGADGWFGSWLGVTQGDQIYGPFQMGPEDGYEESFGLNLNSNQEVNVYFFTSGNSATTAAQCGFRLEGPNGIVLQSGTNPWTDPLKQFPFVYEGTPTCLNYCEAYVEGCMDDQAVNYDEVANTDNGACYYLPGCMQAGYLEFYNQGYDADFDDGSCDVLAVFGCMDDTQYDYDVLANVSTNCTPFIYGCMNDLAFNYDPNANTNDECIPFIYGCTDATALNYDESVNTDDDSCILPVFGCTYPSMFNYDPLANVDNDSCIPFIYGCTDTEAFNFNPLANALDNTCCYLSGCLDPTAFNYDSTACFEPVNSCITIMMGCTDLNADNYDGFANTDDGSCLYDAGCVGEPGDPYWLNDGCYAWVIGVSPNCCNTTWNGGCQDLYNYCEVNDETVGIIDYGNNQITVFPNPTTGFINIATSLQVDISIYNTFGQLVLQENNAKQVDINNLSDGMYQMILTYDGNKFTKKIIKQ